MSSVGPGGMRDMERANRPDEQARPPRGPLMPAEHASEDQEDQIEVIEMVTLEDEMFDETPADGFRWWRVPVIGLPIAVGAGAAAWYFTKGRQPYLNAWELVTRPARTLTRRQSLAARTRKATRKATKRVMKTATATTGTLRGRVADALGGISAAALAGRAGGLWDDTRESVTDLWEDVAESDLARQARGTVENVRKSTSRQLSGMTSGLPILARPRGRVRGRRITGRLTAGPRELILRLNVRRAPWFAPNRARSRVESFRGRANKRIAKLGVATATRAAIETTRARTERAARKRIKRVNSGIKRARIFAFAMFVSAMVIYVRSWYTRQHNSEMRETASGRLEPDTWPRFSDVPSGAAPTATNIPGSPS